MLRKGTSRRRFSPEIFQPLSGFSSSYKLQRHSCKLTLTRERNADFESYSREGGNEMEE